jgi:hypothetical protein
VKFDEAINDILESKMSVQEITDKVVKNPFKYGAEIAEDGDDIVTLYFASSYDREQAIEQLKSMGIKKNKMKNVMGEKSEQYSHQLIISKH